jgi:hypothetical protein
MISKLVRCGCRIMTFGGQVPQIMYGTSAQCDECKRRCSVRRLVDRLPEDMLTIVRIFGGKTFKDQTTTSAISVIPKTV